MNSPQNRIGESANAWVLCCAVLLSLSGCGTPSNSAGSVHGRGLRAPGSTADEAAISQRQEPSDEDALRSSTSGRNPHAAFKGCWYKQGKRRYQAVDMAVGTAGTYPFNAILYYGTTCDAHDVADQIGFGGPQNLSEANYIFWFTAFADKTNMSARWYLGDEQSECVSYEEAPNC
jgi:hypothetical protein